MTPIALALAATLGTSAVASTEVFGDDIITTCDSQWYDDCEEDWAGGGANDSIDLCVSGSNYFAGIAGGTTFPNGIGHTISIGSSDEWVTFGANMHANGAGTAGLKIIFKNSSSTVLSTSPHSISVLDDKQYDLELTAAVPAGATTATLQILAISTTILVDGTGQVSEGLPGGCVPRTQQYCDEKAQEMLDTAEDECDEKGGTFTGECTASPAICNCTIDCLSTCVVGGGTEDAKEICAAF